MNLEAVKARDAALREGGEAWTCKDCEWCSGCNMLRACEAHDDDGDVPALVAEVERLTNRNADLEKELRLAWRVADNAKTELAIAGRARAAEHRVDL